MGMSHIMHPPPISLTNLLAINQMKRIGDYSLKDAELLADSPFVDIFFGMQPTQQEIENSPLEEILTSVN